MSLREIEALISIIFSSIAITISLYSLRRTQSGRPKVVNNAATPSDPSGDMSAALIALTAGWRHEIMADGNGLMLMKEGGQLDQSDMIAAQRVAELLGQRTLRGLA